MANLWTTKVDTPLWADSQKTYDKGLVRSGTSFTEDDFYRENIHTKRVSYLPKKADTYGFGDGWIEKKNCHEVNAVPVPQPPDTAMPTSAEFATFKRVWKWLTQ